MGDLLPKETMNVRLLQTMHNNAFLNMAIDEAISHHVAEGTVLPTLRLYGWQPPAVSIGYFQSMVEEVDLEKCKQHNIDVVRRITGGGAVFHDKELTYSFIIPVQNQLIPFDIKASYKRICDGVIQGLDYLGLKAEFVPLNDIIVNGKKISGNAQTRRNGCILQHGTILIGVDVQKMFSLLKVPDEKIRDKMIKTVEERVTSISQQLNKPMLFETVASSMISGFEMALELNLEPDDLTESEMKLAEKLMQEKYCTKEWNFKR